jgi:hypothetical protein
MTITGGDTIPDVLYGRFSARNSEELIPQLDKTIEYEQLNSNSSFLKSVVLIAGWDYSHTYKWGWPQIKYGIKYYFNEAHGITDLSLFLSKGSHQNESAIKKATK